MMNALLIISSLVMGYVVFMMGFYLLAKFIFPKIEVTEEEEFSNAREALEAKRLREARAAKRSNIYRFNKETTQAA